MSDKPLIALRGVKKTYGSRVAVEIEKFDIRAGERILIVGGNGSGKSTLLRLLAGTTLPTAGKIVRSRECRRLAIGLLAQDAGLYPDRSLHQNYLTYQALYGRRLDGKYHGLVEQTQLKASLHEPVGHLSQGMRQLVGLACLLGAEPDVLILDEPDSNLDAVNLSRMVAACTR